MMAMGVPRTWFLLLLISALAVVSLAGGGRQAWKPDIPKTWDDQAVATLEVLLAEPSASAKHVSADYYYKIPVRPIWKSYPIYAPGHEPRGYMDWLKRQEPAVLWDDGPHRPGLESEADWIKAGELVFDAPIAFGDDVGNTIEDVRDPALYQKLGVPVTKEWVMPFYVYVVRKKGEVELAGFGCGTCHTRVTPQGSVLKGAQGNFPDDRVSGLHISQTAVEVGLDRFRLFWRSVFGAPWVQPDPLARLDQMSAEELASQTDAIPPGVQARQGTSLTSPPQVPDLIGVKDRRYFDHTGLVQHRSIGDLMRYAAINQGEDMLASYGGFIPRGRPDFKKLPDPADPRVGSRYSDEQLYALALYLYSLQPPPNPNKFDALAAKGQRVFERNGCAGCHPPPLYSNNMLTPVDGFTPPKEHLKKYDILAISVGTNPDLALKTRRGTGYYKVPSLKGVWYRGMFGHSGWSATLEDWFDPRRQREDYVPTGFKPYDRKTFPVKGHVFGLDLSPQDKKALIAFLKTL